MKVLAMASFLWQPRKEAKETANAYAYPIAIMLLMDFLFNVLSVETNR
jgi:hypothetical protein